MDNMANILKPLNRCEFTAYEKEIGTDKIGNIEIAQFKDSTGRNRFVVSLDGQAVAGILFDASNVCEFKFTAPAHRKQGMISQLWAYASTKIGKLKHSEYLTELGQKTIK